MNSHQNLPINVVHLLPEIDRKLIELLNSLTPEEWQAQTVAKLWKVKDVVAHLLDGNIRILSMLRDGYFGENPVVHTYQDLLDFLNGLNADWVKAMKRVSPQMLILLHQVTGPLFSDYYASLNLLDTAAFPVAWVGESSSKNWMHIAREYTEKFLHQQQIRDAVNKPCIMTREFYFPFIDIFMRGLPHTFRNVTADSGTSIKVTVISEIGGAWFLVRTDKAWELSQYGGNNPSAEVLIDPDTAWKLFSKSIRPENIKNKVVITGNQTLGEQALNMVSVMA